MGYGTLVINGRTARAHRFSYETFNGPIPVGLFVLHYCDVPACFNPDHLFTGTALDNKRDQKRKGRQKVGEAHWRSKLTEVDVLRVRALAKEKVPHKKIASTIGCSPATVDQIVYRISWRHLPP